MIQDLIIYLRVQDGAGRVGKMIFARQGRKFDYDLKQVTYFASIVSHKFSCGVFFSIMMCYSSDLLVIF